LARIFWFLLSACGSILLLACTNQMGQDLPPTPFIWLLPLTLYLLSFIFCFGREWGRLGRWIWLGLLPVSAGAALMILEAGADAPLYLQIGVHAATLFCGCMACHGELARLKPSPSGLTGFYLVMSVGGVAGGAFVSLAAPAFFPDIWEFHGGWVALCALALAVLWAEERAGARVRWSRIIWAALLVLFLVIGAAFVQKAVSAASSRMAGARNFYGVLKIVQRGCSEGDETASRVLTHGRIRHGFQYLHPPRCFIPTSYYAQGTGIGVIVAELRKVLDEQNRPLRAGIVGLGVGAMSAYIRPGDRITFFEINPEVVRIAKEYFSYWENTPGIKAIRLGDGRLSLEREVREGGHPPLDLLVLDAFTSDAIPLHLLTLEAFKIYFDRMAPDGVLAVHISNRHLDLGPLVKGMAASFGKEAVLLDTNEDKEDEKEEDSATWVLVSGDPNFSRRPAFQEMASPWPPQSPSLIFTDDYSNLFQLLD
jgi:hypothetical protein